MHLVPWRESLSPVAFNRLDTFTVCIDKYFSHLSTFTVGLALITLPRHSPCMGKQFPAKVYSRGRVTIDRDVRAELDIEKGDYVMVTVEELDE